jgi:hypothetical protein
MFSKIVNNNKGIGLISIIILIAFAYAGLTAYSYYNADFNLGKYTPMYFLRNANDQNRKKDLEEIAKALDSYYDENRNLPGQVGFCGRILTVLYPTAKNALSPYFPTGIPQDPTEAGTHRDYFYRHEDSDTYVLMAVLELPPADSSTENYEGCHDWPGDDVYNYMITNE